jgi:CheY-like chemotaxis protein
MIQVVSTRPRVLVAEDHAEMRERIANLLASAFDVVAAVVDGQQAVEVTAALQPEVVVLDISMPVLDGIQAAIRIRRMPRAPKVLFLTAMDDPAISAVAHSLGAAGLVLKVNMMAELIPAIQRALNTPFVHAVYFYPDAQSLAGTVARFIEQGIAADQPALIIARPLHRAAILDQLADIGIDSRSRIERGNLVMLDANDVVSRLMVDDMLSVQCFQDEVLPVLDMMVRRVRHAGARAYGEMVDLLWSSGKEAAALSVEDHWNQLDIARRFSVLCGYSRNAVDKAVGFRKICDRHNYVLPAVPPGGGSLVRG